MGNIAQALEDEFTKLKWLEDHTYTKELLIERYRGETKMVNTSGRPIRIGIH